MKSVLCEKLKFCLPPVAILFTDERPAGAWDSALEMPFRRRDIRRKPCSPGEMRSCGSRGGILAGAWEKGSASLPCRSSSSFSPTRTSSPSLLSWPAITGEER